MSHSSKSSLVAVIVIVAATLDTGSLSAQKAIGSPIAPKLRAALDAEIETTFTTPQGQFSTPGHFYRSRDGKMREDSPLGSMITDVRSGTVTLLNHAKKEAKVIVVTGQPRPSASLANKAAMPQSFEEATIEGHAVTKARKAAGGATQEVWTAKDLGLVVFSKVDAPDFAMTKTLRNFSLREPDPALFRIPSGYTVTHEDAPPMPSATDRPGLFPSQLRPVPRQ
jgi:hypothetical protein